jgi:hypothetical protein
VNRCLPKLLASPGTTVPMGGAGGGKVVRSSAPRATVEAEQDRGGQPPTFILTRWGGRSTRGAHSGGACPVPEPRSVARPATLRELAALPSPYESDEPARLARVCGDGVSNPPRSRTGERLPTRSQHPSATQVTQATPFCHFPSRGQMTRRGIAQNWVAGLAPAGLCTPEVDRGRPTPTPVGLLRLPGFPPRAGRPITTHWR